MISAELKQKIEIYYFTRVAYAYNVLGISRNRAAYELEFFNRKSSIGMCSYKHKKIYLSELYIKHMSFEKICEVINHELAHWAERRGKPHGIEWQQMAIRFGIDPNTCFSSNADGVEYPWLIMYKNEIIGQTLEQNDDIGTRWATGRKRETQNQLYYKPNPFVIDNSIWSEK